MMAIPAKWLFLTLPTYLSDHVSLLQTQTGSLKSLQAVAKLAVLTQNHSSTEVLGIWHTHVSEGSEWCGTNRSVNFRIDRDAQGRFTLDWFQQGATEGYVWLKPTTSGSWSAPDLKRWEVGEITLEPISASPNLKVLCRRPGSQRWEVAVAEQQASDTVIRWVLLLIVSGIGLCTTATLVLLKQPIGSIFSIRILERASDVDGRSPCIDDIRLIAVLLMVLYHALQSLQRLEALKPAGLQFFLHGLAIFVYCSGRSVCLSEAQHHHFASFVHRRALRLLVPAICGWILVVLPTQYFGRHWRPCSPQVNDPWQWLLEYFNPQSQNGVNCDGLGWLGFLLMLFLLQVTLQPWAIALRKGERAAAVRALTILAAGACFGILLLSWRQPVKGGPHPFLPVLCLLPLACELLVVAAVVPGRWQPPHVFWISGIVCRVLCCVALQSGLTQMHFDEFDKSTGLTRDEEGVIQECCLLCLFYSQGFLDELCSRGKVKAVEGRTAAVVFVLVWGIVLPSLCLTPIPGGDIWGTSPRYPSYHGVAGAHFVVRTWMILGVSFFWWQHQAWHISFASSTFPFMLYVVHWLPVDVVLGCIYGGVPKDGAILRIPWFAALLVALITSLGVTAIAQHVLGWLLPKKDPVKDGALQA